MCIIQEATLAQPGTFLYVQIISKGLEGNVKNGRIYCLVSEGIKPGPKPKMLDEPSGKPVSYLDHPDGWRRDNAQKELLVRSDKSLASFLEKMATHQNRQVSALGRLHALGTLNGLGSISKSVLLTEIKDPYVQIRKASMRMTEPYLAKQDPSFLTAIQSMANYISRDVLSQLLLSLRVSGSTQSADIFKKIAEQILADPLLSGIQKSLIKNEGNQKIWHQLAGLPPAARKPIPDGTDIFQSLCAGCHGPEGQGLPEKTAPALIGKFKLIEKKDVVIKIHVAWSAWSGRSANL
ncbi:c-type cytochrome [Dyadobacter psychrotolerans]|uniref:Cytochrome c domain-containing protein n=1 Tax=Dyadobacter psychrotolerans TaxID=2541721 RepID=A0A4R5DM61_9BACT|nr:hypothetical protein [Dyadobacter psychrotolerans]TDE15209.1 hypothetical protein E0F88_11835 [Dyadobacter psychrotolerans]